MWLHASFRLPCRDYCQKLALALTSNPKTTLNSLSLDGNSVEDRGIDLKKKTSFIVQQSLLYFWKIQEMASSMITATTMELLIFLSHLQVLFIWLVSFASFPMVWCLFLWPTMELRQKAWCSFAELLFVWVFNNYTTSPSFLRADSQWGAAELTIARRKRGRIV